MRKSCLPAFLLLCLALCSAHAQTCTGLCLKQVACPNGGTTSISGTVYAPNGVDPLPNVLVFVPNATVAAFTAGVSCTAPGALPSRSPLVATTTVADGTFTLTNVPVGSDIPVVIQSGRWRRQFVVQATSACANTAFSGRMPRNQSEGDIPRIAVATGSVDQVECVLRKVGIDDKEFTDSTGSGRINLYSGSASAGALIDVNTPSQLQLMGDAATLNKYDMLMLPCQGTPDGQTTTAQLSNLLQYANAGGRIYTSHYSEVWLQQNGAFANAVKWSSSPGYPPDGPATVDTSFTSGATLSDWLQVVGASTKPGQIPLVETRQDVLNVVPPTQPWLTLNTSGSPVMQLTFNTPIGAANQCGRVLFNDYHVENPPIGKNGSTTSPTGVAFPAECDNDVMTSQEKLLEYSLFDLANDGGQPTLSPATADFGSEPVGLTTAAQTLTWTNNSIFAATVKSVSVTSDFVVQSNSCGAVAPGATCQISIVYRPTVFGAATGTLTVVSNASTVQATLTGTGAAPQPPSLSPASMDFGNGYVGFASNARIFTWTNGSVFTAKVAPVSVTGAFVVPSNGCATVAPSTSCLISVVFKPSATGAASGVFTVVSTPVGAPPSVAASTTLTSAMTGVGVNPLTASITTATFGNVDVGATVQQTISIINSAPGPVAIPASAGAGDFSLASACGTLPGGSSCTVVVSFKPSATGPRTAQLILGGVAVAASGNGVDFTIAAAPGAGNVIAGMSTSMAATLQPVAGFASNVTVTCKTTAAGSICQPGVLSLMLNANGSVPVAITTTAKYTVIGYEGYGRGLLAFIVSATAGLLWSVKRRSNGSLVTGALLLAVLGIGCMAVTGCGSKDPALNAVATAPGTYAYTVTASDGFLTHSATYNLTVTTK